MLARRIFWAPTAPRAACALKTKAKYQNTSPGKRLNPNRSAPSITKGSPVPNKDIIAGLNPVAADIATRFLAAFPGAVLTSGRRSVAGQASAMASNVVQNQKWIAQTYVPSPAAQACQAWVDAAASCMSGDVISAGLLAVLSTFSDADLNRLSYHLGGNAFDVQPDGDQAKAAWLQNAVAERNAAGGTAKFLAKEGGLTRWHLQAV